MAAEAKQILFQSSLGEVVRKMRGSKKSEQETIQEAIAETKSELSSTVTNVKVTAILKLSYFAMLGYSGEHGAFNIVEIMADANFQHKRVGYVAASLIFRQNTDILPLCTALLKRDMASSNQYEVGLALFCLSCVCTPDLARDLVSDVVALLYSPKPYIRRKAVLCLYKIFVQFPDGLRPTYPKLKEKLVDGTEKSDADPGVRGALVNIFCEMARRNPQNFMNLVPPFFQLLTTIHNNWTLIKVVKMFGYFAPYESRLGKRLVDPLTTLITTTHAKSVQYECIFAVANGMSKVPALIKLAVDKMKTFAESPDQNLKYLGLDAMCRTLADNPKILADQRPTVLRCINDVDPSIRSKALFILAGLTTKKTLEDGINSMFDAAVRTPPDEEWTNTVIETILETASKDDYANVTDFEWYVAVLMDLCQISLTDFKHGARLEQEFISILSRVRAVRQYGVESLCSLLANTQLLSVDTTTSDAWRVLKAAAFLCGEFPHWLPNKAQTVRHLLSEKMSIMPPDLQTLCVSAAGKIFSFMVKPSERHLIRVEGEEDNTDPEDSSTLADVLRELNIVPESKNVTSGLSVFCRSVHPDVQERAQFVAYLSKATPENPIGEPFYANELAAVVVDAQEQIQPPEGLDLDQPFADDLPSLVRDSDEDSDALDSDSDDEEKRDRMQKNLAQSAERIKRRRQDMDAFYLKDDGSPADDLPPVEELEMTGSPGLQGARHRIRGASKSYVISRDLAKPKNYTSPTTKVTAEQQEDEATMRLKNINVAKPVGKDEALPVIMPYKRVDPASLSPDRANAADSGDILNLLDDEARRQAAVKGFAEVELVDNGKIRFVLQVLDQKAKKDGSVLLTLSAVAQNAMESHSLHSVSIAVSPDEVTKVQLTDAEGTVRPSLSMGDKIKNGAQGTLKMGLVFAVYPETIAGAVVKLNVTYTAGKKAGSADAEFPLLFKYFMRAQEDVTSEQYNTDIIPSLSGAGCVSAAIPLPPKYDLSRLLPQLEPVLRMQVVDVYRDVVACYGKALTRKSKSVDSHVAAALMLEEADGERSLNVLVKAHSGAHIEALVQELSGIIHGQ